MNFPALAVLSLALAAVLIGSAVAKLRDRSATASAIRLLRLPAVLRADWVTLALPVGEIVLGLGLLAPWPPVFLLSATVALGLFVAYWAIIARAMTFDPRPSCGCFGRIGNQSVSGATLARNTLFVAAATLVVLGALAGRTVWSSLGGFSGLDWAWLILLIGVAATAVLIFTPFQPAGQGSAPAASPAASQPADAEPDYVRVPIARAHLRSPQGDQTLLRDLAATRAQLLVFTTCQCASTADVWGNSVDWQRQLPLVDIRLITTDRPVEPGEAPAPVWYDLGAAAYTALQLEGSPTAVLLGTDGWVAGGPVTGAGDIAQFVDDIAGAIGELPPEVLEQVAAE